MAKIFARQILGMNDSVRNELHPPKQHNRKIDIPRLDRWIQSNVSNDMVTRVRQIPCIHNNMAVVCLIARGIDI